MFQYSNFPQKGFETTEEKFTLLFAQPGCQVVLQVQAWGMG